MKTRHEDPVVNEVSAPVNHREESERRQVEGEGGADSWMDSWLVGWLDDGQED